MSSSSAFHGLYTYNDSTDYPHSSSDDGPMTMHLTFNSFTHVVNGTGADSLGTFQILGSFKHDTIRFLKSYSESNGNQSWAYVGSRIRAPELSPHSEIIASTSSEGEEEVREYVGEWSYWGARLDSQNHGLGHFAISNAESLGNLKSTSMAPAGNGRRVDAASWEGFYWSGGTPTSMACSITITMLSAKTTTVQSGSGIGGGNANEAEPILETNLDNDDEWEEDPSSDSDPSSITLDSTQAELTGTGIDPVGSFTLQGFIHTGGQVLILKSYARHRWTYYGVFDWDEMGMSGNWGFSTNSDMGRFSFQMVGVDGDGNVGGGGVEKLKGCLRTEGSLQDP